eukprot:TRINITY_DN51464_c0_g1_i1.p2 TRINITY_DN51464_c0_g1~~TRINITY_DN51464_c0_g1_i1.p2  ORF type:complete len:220 (+),score=3.52 TRINITY_DN51464_c0_g1_i1:48-662(+)
MADEKPQPVPGQQYVLLFAGSTSTDKIDPAFKEAGEKLAAAMIKRKWGLVYGGGGGLMEVVSKSVAAAGLPVQGIMPHALAPRELNDRQLKTIWVEDMQTRKQEMFRWADIVISLAGGIGTLDETFEALCYNQLNIKQLKIGLVNTKGYWDPFEALIAKIVGEGMANEDVKKMCIKKEDPEELLAAIESTPVVQGSLKLDWGLY